MELRDYQKRSLGALRGYFRRVTDLGNPDVPFYEATRRSYVHVEGMEGVPYICLRVPTGGGKTLVACHATGIAASEHIGRERPVVLWLAPGNVIVEQTLAALKTPGHPYRAALQGALGGGVQVLTVGEALSVSRSDLDGAATVIVGTMQAFRVEQTDGRKVYEQNGALQHHFDGLNPMLSAVLETEALEDGRTFVPYSLANVLRVRRPIVVMDEAHNARTALSFKTLLRCLPSSIIEFTATPELKHDPSKGKLASNVLHTTSAAELKAEEMVKLPVMLRTKARWQEVVADAVAMQRVLENEATKEHRDGADYLRPIVLVQAEKKSGDLTVEVLRDFLVEQMKIPAEQIAQEAYGQRETQPEPGSSWERLEDEACPIRFVLTVDQLREGWDCPSAYVLCSVRDLKSSKAVEQIVGRVLRQPGAKRRESEVLNRAYAYVASDNFISTLTSLRDAVVDQGFEKQERDQLVVAQPEDEGPIGGTLFASGSETVSEAPDLSALDEDLRERVSFVPERSELEVRGVLTIAECEALKQTFSKPADQDAVERVFHQTQGRYIDTAAVKDELAPLHIPALSVRSGKSLNLFDASFFEDVGWRLDQADPTLSEALFPSQDHSARSGQIDVSETGQVESEQFADQLEKQLQITVVEPNWTTAELVRWLDAQIPHPDATLAQSQAFLAAVLERLMSDRGVSLDWIAQRKFKLKRSVEALIDTRRREARHKGYQDVLFGDAGLEVEVGPDVLLTLDPDRYAPNQYYKGGHKLTKHYFPVIGDLGAGEELQCAMYLDAMPEVKHWVRNLVRSTCSFWLPMPSGKFYPDFVATLKDGRFLIVEYKGGHLDSAEDARLKRTIGQLWADRSGGQCVFVMPTEKRWNMIDEAIELTSK